MNPDAVVVAGYYQEGGLILKKMREMGMNQPVLGDNGFVSPELLKIAGVAADNVYVSSMWSADRNSQATKDFVKNFKAKYNRSMCVCLCEARSESDGRCRHHDGFEEGQRGPRECEEFRVRCRSDDLQ